ncbi:hypothetical protein FB451DRAFT_1293179 [Mycena latifolia]|nr:hypothetical protein FB451DRAFT_1293179 [Mycena latifolia]
MSNDPRLPPELERQIFELAAFIDPDHMTDLFLTAQRVKLWIEILLCRVLYVYGPEHDYPRPPSAALTRYRNLIHTKPASFFHDHVRHLFFVGIQSADEVARILSISDATVNIALSLFTGPAPILPLLGALPLQRFSAYLSHLFTTPSGPDFTHPLFAQMTHLDIRDPYFQGSPDFVLIPHLTHLSIRRTTVSTSVCGTILADCKSLKVLVILLNSQSALDATAPYFAEVAADPRFVMIAVADYEADWELGARGGEDYWARAEELVNRRGAVSAVEE